MAAGVFVSKAIVAFANRVCHLSVAFLQFLRSMFNLHNFANPLYRRAPRITSRLGCLS